MKFIPCLFILITIALSGCATSMSKEQCENANWNHIGYIDAEKGRPIDYQSNHEYACKDAAKVDSAAYKEGWHDGLKTYCTPTKGYDMGAIGMTSLCPEKNFQSLTNNMSLAEKFIF